MLLPKKVRVRDPKLLRSFHEFCVKHDIGCLICSNPNIQIHHGIYRSQGGSDTWDNLYPLCPKCHDVIHYDGKSGYWVIVERKESIWQQLNLK